VADNEKINCDSFQDVGSLHFYCDQLPSLTQPSFVDLSQGCCPTIPLLSISCEIVPKLVAVKRLQNLLTMLISKHLLYMSKSLPAIYLQQLGREKALSKSLARVLAPPL